MMVICGATGVLIHCWWECKLVHAATLEDNLAASSKTELLLLLPCDSAIMLFGTYSNELKSYVHPQMFIALHS